jgi:hypothetical protein
VREEPFAARGCAEDQGDHRTGTEEEELTMISKRLDGSATCHYENHSTFSSKNPVVCHGKLSFIVHDKRGCHLVCQAHAKWRRETSQAMGHSDDCANRFDVHWKQVTVV